ncbi:MAG TPA: hypothetical protein VLC54_20820 [Anaeromyxobacter sp.]|nr:hypothetical protein [Anaeromyxobacter sp.]
MKRLLLAGAAAAALVTAVPAPAQTAATRYVFVAVDAIEIQYTTVRVTGVVDGESAARTVTASFYSGTTSVDQVAACERLALLAMTRPGQFRFEILQASSSTVVCKLARVTP